MRGKVELVLFLQDRIPRNKLPHGLIEVLQPRLVRGKKYDCVPVQTRGRTPHLEHRLGRCFSGIVRPLAVGGGQRLARQGERRDRPAHRR